jgi:hypothetical protein
MRGRDPEGANAVRAQFGQSHAQPLGLSFNGELERAFQAQTADGWCGAFANDAPSAVLFMNLVAIAVWPDSSPQPRPFASYLHQHRGRLPEPGLPGGPEFDLKVVGA